MGWKVLEKVIYCGVTYAIGYMLGRCENHENENKGEKKASLSMLHQNCLKSYTHIKHLREKHVLSMVYRKVILKSQQLRNYDSWGIAIKNMYWKGAFYCLTIKSGLWRVITSK